jgi:hypothetical protein
MISSSVRRGQLHLRNTIVVALAILLLTFSPPGARAANDARQKYPPAIVFMTDFGVLDDSVAICRGVMYGIMPPAHHDPTHQVTLFDLRRSTLSWSHAVSGDAVVVVDPGVGVRGRRCRPLKKGQYLYCPTMASRWWSSATVLTQCAKLPIRSG